MWLGKRSSLKKDEWQDVPSFFSNFWMSPEQTGGSWVVLGFLFGRMTLLFCLMCCMLLFYFVLLLLSPLERCGSALYK